MKIEGNEKCDACPRVLASVVFRYPVFRCYSSILPLFCGVLAIPLVFRIPLLFRGCIHGCSVFCRSVFRCSWFYSMPFLRCISTFEGTSFKYL